jgi:serine/threonine-protein kinase
VVTAFAAGGSLAQRIRQHASHGLPLSDAFAIIAQVGQALTYLHQQHIIHRGVQPASIVFDSAGKSLLTGFDLAMLAPTSGHNLPSYQIGATHYMALEQSKGQVSVQCDQYALGAIAYELCTGRRLKDAGSLASSGQQRPRPPRQLNSALPIQADRAILRAVATNPDLRYDTVEAFVRALGTL